MKIYTKSGDKGITSIPSKEGSSRLVKCNPIFNLLGGLDELNSHIGLCLSSFFNFSEDELFIGILKKVQSRLFQFGAEIITEGQRSNEEDVEKEISEMETEIDRLDCILPGLKNFILPGGQESAARMHVTRSVCRRIERDISIIKNDERWASAVKDNIEPLSKYINRLSDFLFVAARYVNHRSGVKDTIWTPNK